MRRMGHSRHKKIRRVKPNSSGAEGWTYHSHDGCQSRAQRAQGLGALQGWQPPPSAMAPPAPGDPPGAAGSSMRSLPRPSPGGAIPSRPARAEREPFALERLRHFVAPSGWPWCSPPGTDPQRAGSGHDHEVSRKSWVSAPRAPERLVLARYARSMCDGRSLRPCRVRARRSRLRRRGTRTELPRRLTDTPPRCCTSSRSLAAIAPRNSP